MKVSLLVPFRAQEGSTRATAWEWIREYWARDFPRAEVITGSCAGEPFSKTEAVNDAYSRSTGDVLAVMDADAVIEPCVIEYAGLVARESGTLVVPWRRSLRLTRQATARLIAGESLDAVRRTPADAPPPLPVTAGILFVISRKAFESVNGMDARFRGWGHEDVAFKKQCDYALGRPKLLDGHVVCLYHERPRTRLGRTWGAADEGARNGGLLDQYLRAKSPRAMRELILQHPLGRNPVPLPARTRAARPSYDHVARERIT